MKAKRNGPIVTIAVTMIAEILPRFSPDYPNRNYMSTYDQSLLTSKRLMTEGKARER
jgi:hypothetical protein